MNNPISQDDRAQAYKLWCESEEFRTANSWNKTFTATVQANFNAGYEAALAHERQRNTSVEAVNVSKACEKWFATYALRNDKIDARDIYAAFEAGTKLFTAPPQSQSEREALEAAAKLCANQPNKDKLLQDAGGQDPDGDYVIGYRDGCGDCANRIRALIQDTQEGVDMDIENFPKWEEVTSKITDSRFLGHPKIEPLHTNCTKAGARIIYDHLWSWFHSRQQLAKPAVEAQTIRQKFDEYCAKHEFTFEQKVHYWQIWLAAYNAKAQDEPAEL